MNRPWLTRQQVREVDRLASERCGLSGLILMENAGRSCVDRLCGLGVGGPVLICCGPGNNGGDGFVMARHLAVRGFAARVLLFCDPQRLRGDAATNFQILTCCGGWIDRADGWDVPQITAALQTADWIVDALLGTGSRGQPRPPLDGLIPQLNAAPGRRLAVDLPSGLDCDTGTPAASTFRADHTCTFIARKTGFAAPEAQRYLGEVHVEDIGIPWPVVEQLLDAPAAGSD